ncbi:hypothetical protein FRB90_006944 [Tulasnella sp. 427]|nr:hypothetical protein FRB90_006944 [Tulasnella sp. 427]
MTRHFDEKFEKMDERLERLEAHAVHVDNQLERLEAHAVHVDNQLERLQAHAVGMDERLDRMDENIKTELRSAGKNFEDLAEYLKVMNESLQNQLRGLTIKIDKVESGAELLCRELLDDDTENREAHASIGAEHERIRDLIYRLRPCSHRAPDVDFLEQKES